MWSVFIENKISLRKHVSRRLPATSSIPATPLIHRMFFFELVFSLFFSQRNSGTFVTCCCCCCCYRALSLHSGRSRTMRVDFSLLVREVDVICSPAALFPAHSCSLRTTTYYTHLSFVRPEKKPFSTIIAPRDLKQLKKNKLVNFPNIPI